MARKSRRQQERQDLAEKIPGAFQTAAYCRLSVEDKEQDSIRTQIMLVQEYIRGQPELRLAGTYVDNGVTGTKFDRPEWNRLMDDVRSGKIQCIVVKDLSRFGRDYLEAGYYIENIFPKLHVRFIAVTDNFDSSRPEDMDDITVPVRNMVNAMYAKDASRKIRAVRQGIMERGERFRNSPPLGYMYENSRKDRLVVDEETAGIIRMIFYWADNGAGRVEIGKRLTFLKIPSPRQWQRNRSNGTIMDPVLPWDPGTLERILSNRAYVGDTVTGMTRVNMHRQVRMDEDDWYVTENTHEAIIERELFGRVQAATKERRNKLREKKEQNRSYLEANDSPLRGLVFCGICGSSCELGRVRSKAKSQNEKLGVLIFRCTKHYSYHYENRCQVPVDIRELKLRMIVMDRISDMIRILAEKAELMREDRSDSLLARKNRSLQGLKLQRRKAQGRSDKLFEDYVDGVIDSEEYILLKEKYRGEMSELDRQIGQAEMEIRVIRKKAEHIFQLIDMAMARKDRLAYDEELVRALVEKIEINADEQVTIHFRFDDEIKELLEK